VCVALCGSEPGSEADQIFTLMDDFFTFIFFAELIWNLLANWFWPFFTDGWSVFDLLVVTVSLVAYFGPDGTGGPIKTLRLMRAFRVMRLFGRLQSLRQIIASLTASLIPVCNAFLIMLLVTSIYAILGVNFYSEASPHFFGTFSRALFTLFQVCTGDGWASDIARPIFSVNAGEGQLDGASAAFFISFIVIVGWVLLQVVVAVLLDNFTAAAEEEKQRLARLKSKFDGRTPVVHAIDPLLAALAHFDTTEDLSHRIGLLFNCLDTDDSRTLTYAELAAGLKKLRVNPQVQISEDDWDVMTLNGTLLNPEKELGPKEFAMVSRCSLTLRAAKHESPATTNLHVLSTLLQTSKF